MAISIKTKNGLLDIETEAIAAIVGSAATNSVGVVGMSSRSALRDARSTVLGKEDYGKGIAVYSDKKTDDVTVDAYIIARYGTNLKTVLKSVQENIRRELEVTLGLNNPVVNIIIQGVN